MSKINLVFSSYLLTIVALFFYTFTQVDLSLTLFRSSIFQAIEKNFQYLGFFQRPLSAAIFSIILVLLFLFYFWFLYLSKKDKLKPKNLKLLVLLTSIILIFSYNAFSYDLFNYIFDAKIVTFYNSNPYLHKALDFPNDPMLSFMRWTHRLYPYGPSWLLLTVSLSFIGANIFLLTFFLFKVMVGGFYLGSAFLIYKISQILSTKNKIFNTAFFALNPLIIIESLVSAHNDIPMIFFALLSIYFYLHKSKIISFLSLIFSIGIKYFSFVLLPIYFLNKINYEKIFLITLLLSIGGIVYATFRTTFQPWYLLFPFALASFISNKYYVFIPSMIFTIFASLIYIPYVLLTDYSGVYPKIVSNIEVAGVFIATTFTILYVLKRKFV